MKAIDLISKKRKISKPLKVNQKKHFKQRWYERCGFILTDEKYDQIAELTHKTGVFLHKCWSGNSVFKVKIDGAWTLIVYDALKQIPITVLEWKS
jgi:hypothetical protein